MKKQHLISSFLTIAFFFSTINIIKSQDVNKAMRYLQTKQYAQAAIEFEGALPAVEKEYGNKDTLNYAKMLFYTALCYDYAHTYSKAEFYYMACNTVYLNYKALKSSTYGNSCNFLAGVYYAMGTSTKNNNGRMAAFKKAAQYYLETRKIFKKIYGERHSYYAVNCNNIAFTYDEMNNYQKAEGFVFSIGTGG